MYEWDHVFNIYCWCFIFNNEFTNYQHYKPIFLCILMSEIKFISLNQTKFPKYTIYSSI